VKAHLFFGIFITGFIFHSTIIVESMSAVYNSYKFDAGGMLIEITYEAAEIIFNN
jgi:hypothetical protein